MNKKYIEKRKWAIANINKIIEPTARNRQSGIYLYIRKDEKGIVYFYCGLAKDLYERQIGHWLGYQRIDISMRKRGWESNENPYGWRFEIVEFCNESELNDREQYWIFFYMQLGYQTYNSTYGSQSDGKTATREYKEPKGYRQGIETGYEKARKQVAQWFAKSLDFSIKGKSNKNKEKAFEKFAEFIKIVEQPLDDPQ